jgi:hypothetical protein
MAGRRPMMSTSLFGSSLCRMVAVAVAVYKKAGKNVVTNPSTFQNGRTPEIGSWENERSRLGAKRGVYVFVYLTCVGRDSECSEGGVGRDTERSVSKEKLVTSRRVGALSSYFYGTTLLFTCASHEQSRTHGCV